MTQPMAETTDPAVLQPFKVAQVELTEPPNGGQGENWYRYVLDNGRSTITGKRRGSSKEVRAYAVQCAERLNTRGRLATPLWNPRGKKPAAANAT